MNQNEPAIEGVRIVEMIRIDCHVDRLERCQTELIAGCIGGEVNEEMLAALHGCKLIRSGGLIFTNTTGNITDLSSLQQILYLKGPLIIESTDFVVFEFLPRLEFIVNPEEGPGIRVNANPKLVFFELPKLRSLESTEEPKVVILENPNLVIGEKLSNFLRKLPDEQKNITAKQVTKEPQDLHSTSNTTEEEIHPDDPSFVAIAVPLAILFIALCGAFMWAVKKKRITFRRARPCLLPAPNYQLEPKAQVILLSLCQDIMLFNPLIWKFEESKLLWPQEQGECE
ncbi:hypothetical protein Y032_0007g3411 [Ancylostoma ceylanicum]|uniref:Receptor L-domain domain-containing protein n=1 Tax=Ancylostoma ceylanicum TaxID=53326 RepID=A0A016VMC7_9BILA|nr:hypothetical protein Y032_0007g3411 [Ancylostoma ceylanicum]